MITVEQVALERLELEIKILTLLSDFEVRNNVSISSVQLSTMDDSTFSKPAKSTVSTLELGIKI